jgi:hypothetical protein
METGFTTPLLDFFRQGGIDRDVRLQAARGELAPRNHEQVALLMLLAADSEAEIASLAEATLQAIPREALSEFLARVDTSHEVRDFFATRGIVPAVSSGSGDDTPLVPAPDSSEPGDDGVDTPESGAAAEDERSLLQRLAGMTVAQRVVRAMKGSREERAVLIRDSSKLVSAAVLSSPKLTESEVESIARMANVTDDVLRIIGRTRAWVKNYQVAAALARNPTTPVALSMNQLSRLTDKDLKVISTDRNVPDVLRATARRRVTKEK